PPAPSSFSRLSSPAPRDLPSFPTRRSSDLQLTHFVRKLSHPSPLPGRGILFIASWPLPSGARDPLLPFGLSPAGARDAFLPFGRSEEHTSELQSRENLVCRLLLEKKKATHV